MSKRVTKLQLQTALNDAQAKVVAAEAAARRALDTLAAAEKEAGKLQERITSLKAVIVNVSRQRDEANGYIARIKETEAPRETRTVTTEIRRPHDGMPHGGEGIDGASTFSSRREAPWYE